MDAQQFLAEFGHIANAPGGVARLRELVFSLAFDGKLLSNTEVVEQTHLDKVADFVMGQAPPGNECNTRGEGTIFVKTGEFGELYPIVREWTTKPLKLAKQGDVLICVVGATVGKLNLAIDCAIGRSVAAIRPHSRLTTKYLYFMLMPFTMRLRSGSRGSAQGVIGKAELSAIKLRVPTEEEQSRIVAKVDELMALCDQLEAQQQERRQLQNALRQSTLQALASAQSPHELQDSWQRLQANFGRLFSEPEDVGELRNLVLQLGIRGLLVDQIDAGQASVDEFVASVKAKRDELVAGGVIRRSASLPQVEQSEEMFPLPRGWRFCRLGEVSICRDGQRVPLSKIERAPRQGTYPYYGASGIIDRIDGYIFDESLLLVGEDGANLINRSTPIAFIASGRYWVNNHAHVLDSVDLVALKYLEVFINAIDLKPHVTGTAQPKMNQEKMNLIVVAVPPPEEQALIVERVSELMQVCDEIEKQLRDAVALVQHLATAAVGALTGITIEQEQEASVKVPQTELIAPLRLGTPPDVKAQAPLATLLARHNGEMSARDLWQRFGGEIDAFYAQLKTEVAHGWIAEPAVAEAREKSSAAAGA